MGLAWCTKRTTRIHKVPTNVSRERTYQLCIDLPEPILETSQTYCWSFNQTYETFFQDLARISIWPCCPKFWLILVIVQTLPMPPVLSDLYSSTCFTTWRCEGYSAPFSCAGSTKSAPAFSFFWISVLKAVWRGWGILSSSLSRPEFWGSVRTSISNIWIKIKIWTSRTCNHRLKRKFPVKKTSWRQDNWYNCRCLHKIQES